MLVTGDDIIYAAFTFGTNLRDRQALDFTGRDFRPETYHCRENRGEHGTCQGDSTHQEATRSQDRRTQRLLDLD